MPDRGPVGRRLMQRYKIGRPAPTVASPVESPAQYTTDEPHQPLSADSAQQAIQEDGSFDMTMYAVVLLAVAIGFGTVIIDVLADYGITFPAYLGAMIVAAVIRNTIDWRGFRLPEKEFSVMGNVSLAFFLVMALMAMKLWELAEVAGPLLVILIAQTVLMFLFASYVTFKVMGSDYDAVVIATGHCGFGMGATPNAMANMQSFTAQNGYSTKAFLSYPW